MSAIITAIIVLLVLGLIVWAISTYLPIPQPFKGVIIVLLVVIACIYLLRLAGVY